MAATLYSTALAALLNETLDWTAEEIKVILLGPSYVFDSLSIYAGDIPTEHIIAISELGLANRTYEDGIARGDPAQFLQLLSNQEITSLIVFQDVGDIQYSQLIAFYGPDHIVGAPKIPLGTDEYVYAPVSPGGWFQIIDSDLVGSINTYPLGGDAVSIAELDGGLSLVMPALFLGSALNVSTHIVCAGPDETDSCCGPTIRSSRCD